MTKPAPVTVSELVLGAFVALMVVDSESADKSTKALFYVAIAVALAGIAVSRAVRERAS